MLLNAEYPLGIFDSGVGGLTVASAIRNVLPNERIIYFGDLAHLPYGDKSSHAIQHYSVKIAEFLLENHCKLILIACNTASAHAYTLVKEHIGEQAIVLNVIDPVVDYVIDKGFSKIGIIGTKGTIQSGMYPLKIKQKFPKAEVFSLATPLLAPMIEEGFVYDDISNAIIRAYLSQQAHFTQLDCLILGCTHYPIIKNQIRKFYDFQVNIIDSSQIVAQHAKNVLARAHLLNTQNTLEHKFYVSDYTESFEKISQMFFEEGVCLTQLNFWS